MEKKVQIICGELNPERLTEARKWADLNKAEAGRRVRRSRSFMQKLEAGKVRHVSKQLLDDLASAYAGSSLLSEVDSATVMRHFVEEALLTPNVSSLPTDLKSARAAKPLSVISGLASLTCQDAVA